MWLHTARMTTLHLTNECLVYEAAGDGRRLVVALSVGDQPTEVPAAHAGQVLAGGAHVMDAGSPRARLRLPAHGWAVLEG